MEFVRSIRITHGYGIHARPSASLNETGKRFKGQFFIIHKGIESSTSDILALLSMGIEANEVVEIRGVGEEAEIGVNALIDLVRNDFNL